MVIAAVLNGPNILLLPTDGGLKMECNRGSLIGQ